MTAKLHEVLAVEKDLMNTSKRLVAESIRTFSKDNLFKGSKKVTNIFDSFFVNMKTHSVRDLVNNNGSKWRREYILDDDKYTVNIGKKKDQVKTKITVHNGYDGKTSVGVTFSAWREICSNGMMGWKKVIGKKFSHFNSKILDNLSNTINEGFTQLSNNFNKWESWSDTEYTEKDFQGFVDKADFLSDKQKKATIDMYKPIMVEYNEDSTKWGAYNVITAIASHHISSRNKKVPVEFSKGYSNMEKTC